MLMNLPLSHRNSLKRQTEWQKHNMTPYRHTRFSTWILLVFFCCLAVYAYYESRAYLYGPRITIPEKATLVHDPIVMVRGKAEHITSLFMNGTQIPVSEDGSFEQPYALAKGYNKVILYATDQYGTGEEKFIEIIYEPLIIEEVTTQEATSTPPLAPRN
jgi:hypothetical protein